MGNSEKVAFDVTPYRFGNELATAYIEEKIEAVRQIIDRRPGPSAGSMSDETMRWSRLYMATYGKAIGAIEALTRFDKLPPELAAEMERKLKSMLNFYHSTVLLGQQ